MLPPRSRNCVKAALAAALLATPLFGVGCQKSVSAKPNVLLVVIDTLRADRLGTYGNERGLTPFLDSLAARGSVFFHAYSTSSWTCPSVASLFTSRYPSQHNAVTFTAHLVDEEVTLAERVQAAGYDTAGFSANPRLLQRLGYAQGFATWRADAGAAPGGLAATEINAQALQWLDDTAKEKAPKLLYVHYMEPHSPYTPPEPFLSRFVRNDSGEPFDVAASLENLRDKVLAGQPIQPSDVTLLRRRYDAEVATVDDRIRALFAALGERGFLHDAIIVVTADHGEEFAEHGNSEHGKALYEESVRVPLIVITPGVESGQRVDRRVSLVDVAPTLLDLLGLEAEPRFEGRSLRALLRGGQAREAHADILLQLPFTELGRDVRVHDRGLIRGDAKLLEKVDGSMQRFDLAADPGEQHASKVAADAPLRIALDAASAKLLRRRAQRSEVEGLSEGEREKLRALGYGLE